MKLITTDPDFREATAAAKPTIAVFKTTWCKDCHYIEPFMPELEQQYKELLSFIQIDRDDLPDLCEELKILGIPSFIGFVEGKETIRFVSKLRKNREEITEFLDRVIAVSQAMTN